MHGWPRIAALTFIVAGLACRWGRGFPRHRWAWSPVRTGGPGGADDGGSRARRAAVCTAGTGRAAHFRPREPAEGPFRLRVGLRDHPGPENAPERLQRPRGSLSGRGSAPVSHSRLAPWGSFRAAPIPLPYRRARWQPAPLRHWGFRRPAPSSAWELPARSAVFFLTEPPGSRFPFPHWLVHRRASGGFLFPY